MAFLHFEVSVNPKVGHAAEQQTVILVSGVFAAGCHYVTSYGNVRRYWIQPVIVISIIIKWNHRLVNIDTLHSVDSQGAQL